MRLIFINRFFYPDHSATSQMLTDLVLGLAGCGHDVFVLTSRLRYDDGNAELATQESLGGVRIKRIWTSRFGRSSLLLRAIDYLTFYVSLACVLVRTARREDVLIAMTDPPALSVIAAIVAKWRGASLVNWQQDIFPEVAEALNVVGSRLQFLFAVLRILRNASLRCARMNIAIGELMAARLRSFGVDWNRILVVPNWADTDAVRPILARENDLRRRWKVTEEEFVVGYSGNLGRAHDVETLINAIAATAKPVARKSGVRWLFIGGGAQYDRLRHESQQRGFEHVSFQPYQPREALSESLSVPDVHIVSLKPELEGLIVPSKFYGIAAAGRPSIFIGSPDGEVARLIERYGCGVTVTAGDAAALIATVMMMARSPDLCHAMGSRAHAMLVEHFSKASALEKWQRLIKSVARSVV